MHPLAMTRMMAARAGLLPRERRLLSTAAAASHGNPLAPFLRRQRAVLLDGGFGTALGAESQQHVLWGAQHLFRKAGHDKVQAVHRGFLAAGADIITSNSYNASYELFKNAGAFTDGVTLPGGVIEQEQLQQRFSSDVLRAAVELAKQSRHLYWTELTQGNYAEAQVGDRLRPLVAASIGPAGDHLNAFTGPSDPNTCVRAEDMPDEAVSAYYSRKISALCKAKPDLLAFETLPSLYEARLALAALDAVAPELEQKHGLVAPPAWVSFICYTPEGTAAGDDFGQAVAEVSQHPRVAAVGLNCTAPAHVGRLLERARSHAPDATLLAYPNSGASWDAREEARCWRHASQDDAVLDGTHALAMHAAGASVVGGCCNVTAGQVRQFREALLGR